MLRILEEKGHAHHTSEGPRYVYSPTVPPEEARRSALSRIVHTFFDGHAEDAVAALLDLEGDELDEAALERLAERIEDARREGR
jgi:predicted transcriptional regulator